MLHPELVGLLVALDARSLHRWPFRRVEEPIVDTGYISRQPHGTAQRVDFPHYLALGLPPDCGVAAHLADGVEVSGQQQRVHAHPG